ncbi:hypothetical protein FRC03_006440 [Tulasnella sp. 419]|nr:hypothetical protein FRC03_006440 [Tulasnella sp. 419]
MHSQIDSTPEATPTPQSRPSTPEFTEFSGLGAGQTSTITPNSATTILLQEKCYQHRYIRDKDVSGIVERPERLRAVACGLAAGISRLEEESNIPVPQDSPDAGHQDDKAEDLSRALSHLTIAYPPAAKSPVCDVIHSNATVDLLSHPAVQFVHARPGDVEQSSPRYPENLKLWSLSSEEKIAAGASEIPDGLPQGDLYLSPGSLEAIEGAVGTVCQAIDLVAAACRDHRSLPNELSRPGVSSSEPSQRHWPSRVFTAIRPPGHHCGEETPSGFCFINNVAVGAAHAYLKHGIDRVAILDIDLHHGNGTQKIAWAINEETHRKDLEGRETKRGLKIFYGSLHDILSYPCEDGDATLVRDASVSLHNAHGQFIENVHLESYVTEEDFHNNLYSNSYSRLIEKARAFFRVTQASPENSLLIISCGFDACEHEYPTMSRHNRNVPVSFYERFARDARVLAEEVSKGKVVSVLEGGYSDRALTSGAMAHLAGLTGSYQGSDTYSWNRRGQWWSADNLNKIERATKLSRKTRNTISSSIPYGGPTQEPWLVRALEIFSTLDRMPIVNPRNRVPTPQANPRMTLRERKKPAGPGTDTQTTPTTSPAKSTRPSPSRNMGATSATARKPRKSGGGGAGKASSKTKASPISNSSDAPDIPQDYLNPEEDIGTSGTASDNHGKDNDLTEWRNDGKKTTGDSLVEASRTKGSGEHTTDPPITIKIRIPRQSLAQVDKSDT